MKNLLIAAAVITWGLVGCGGGTPTPSAQAPVDSSPGTTSTSQVAASEQATQAAAPVVLPVDVNSSPQEVVLAFLNGMRDGNSGTTAALLTRTAQEETVKHNWPVQPPGAPSATYQLGQAQYADASQTVVQVPCIWTEPDGESGTVKFEVVWNLRREEPGWRVAGFATEVVPGRPLFYFNFEDIAGLRASQAEAEAALTEALGNQPTGVAERPTENALR